jgi:hypothetical protein
VTLAPRQLQKAVAEAQVFKRLKLKSKKYLSMLLWGPIAGFFLLGTSVAQSDLPPEVRAEILNKQIFESIRSKNYQKALEGLDEYHKLEVPVPVALLYEEAIRANDAGDP